MAFDPQDNLLNLETDIATVQANYLDGALYAGALACIEKRVSDWSSHDVMPSEEVFQVAEAFSNNEEPTDPGAAATYLLFVREAVRG